MLAAMSADKASIQRERNAAYRQLALAILGPSAPSNTAALVEALQKLKAA